MVSALRPERLTHLHETLYKLREHALHLERNTAEALAQIANGYSVSARNLIHYLAIRQHDIRELQKDLSQMGLSSLSVLEPHVIASLDAVLTVLDHLRHETSAIDRTAAPVDFDRADQLLHEHATRSLGPAPAGNATRIMVTMPSEAAEEPQLIESFLAQGMTMMRINCAHDHPDAWAAMLDNLHRAEAKLGKSCRVAFDLAGPKLRTGAIEPGPEVMRFKPTRDALGRVSTPAIVRFSVAPDDDDDEAFTLPVEPTLIRTARPGDRIRLEDARGRHRELQVDMITEQACICTSDRTGYVTSDTRLSLIRDDVCILRSRVGHLPAREQALVLEAGDSLIVTLDSIPGRPALHDEHDKVLEPAHIGCSLPELLTAVQAGQRILFDDGKFEGTIREVRPDQFRVELFRAGTGTAKLRAEKGINVPDTQLQLSALTKQDLEDLKFVARHAHMVSLSFVHTPGDIEQLHGELERLGAHELGIILKIENRQAFEQLPRLLMTALRRPPVAVMVARGDLGVEIGFERMAEVQEEMLWLCESAHVPVIWATQVLESLAKEGVPSRGDVTDAAMSSRAECVMLNKGPYMSETIRFLSNVSQRMSQHRVKRVATLRRLSVADAYQLPSQPQ
jgi:pyruvate kinase